MGDKHPLYGPSTPIMTFSEKLRSSPSAVIRYLPRIISYLPLVDSLMWHFHVTILVALNSSKQKSIFAFFDIVKFPACVSHIAFSVFLFNLWRHLTHKNRRITSAVQYNLDVLKLRPSPMGVHTTLYYWGVMTIFSSYTFLRV